MSAHIFAEVLPIYFLSFFMDLFDVFSFTSHNGGPSNFVHNFFFFFFAFYFLFGFTFYVYAFCCYRAGLYFPHCGFSMQL